MKKIDIIDKLIVELQKKIILSANNWKAFEVIFKKNRKVVLTNILSELINENVKL